MASWWSYLTRIHRVGTVRKAWIRTVWWPGRCLVAGPGGRRSLSRVFAFVWSGACHPSEPELLPTERLAMLHVPGIPWLQFPVTRNVNTVLRGKNGCRKGCCCIDRALTLRMRKRHNYSICTPHIEERLVVNYRRKIRRLVEVLNI
jgi:hypothetical protein